MAEKFRNRYRVASARARWWDYGNNAAYFITICTQNRECFFGFIRDNKMILNELGQIAEKFWAEIPNQFQFSQLGAYIVMPNHVHGIIIIDKPLAETRLIASLPSPSSPSSTSSPPPPPKKTGGFAKNKNPMINENVSRIIRWYKGRCSFEIRKINPGFSWQSRFHDHIIRNKVEYQRITNYIINNPLKWNYGNINNRNNK